MKIQLEEQEKRASQVARETHTIRFNQSIITTKYQKWIQNGL